MLSYETFQNVLEEEFKQIQELFERKNRLYGCREKGDVLYNFRETAQRVFGEDSPEAMFKTLLVLADKHWVALTKNGLRDPEVVERLRDMIVYCLLAIGIIFDEDDRPTVACEESQQ